MVRRHAETKEILAERKRKERERWSAEGWRYVSVRCPPGIDIEIRQLAARRRKEFLRAVDR